MGLFDGHSGELSLLSLYCTNAILVGLHSITMNIRLQAMASVSTMPVTRGIEVWSWSKVRYISMPIVRESNKIVLPVTGKGNRIVNSDSLRGRIGASS